ncbi:hypothetical protein, partial [Nocardia brasiliensis]|uniref:hypothetical protein n=1 Tax=Nocardia brasiliensis TaxID=37326 RepID=UPI00245539F8
MVRSLEQGAVWRVPWRVLPPDHIRRSRCATEIRLPPIDEMSPPPTWHDPMRQVLSRIDGAPAAGSNSVVRVVHQLGPAAPRRFRRASSGHLRWAGRAGGPPARLRRGE